MKLPIPDSLPDWEIELEELVIAQLRGDITPEQHGRLCDMLRTHSLVRKAYLRRMQLESMLEWEFSGDADTTDVSDERQAHFENHEPQKWQRWLVPAAIAALLAVGIYFGFHQSENPSSHEDYTAQLLHLDTPSWHRGKNTPNSGEHLNAGSLFSLTSGIATLDFQGGARITLEGTTKLYPLGRNDAQLLNGNLSLNLPVDADPFTLKLPNDSSLQITGGSSVAVVAADSKDACLYVLSGNASMYLKDGSQVSLLPKTAITMNGRTASDAIYQPELAPPVPALGADPQFQKRTWIEQLDLRFVEQGWGKTRALTSVDGGPISIGGKVFSRGFGTHAQGYAQLSLPAGSSRLIAHVGADDEHLASSVQFIVLSEGRELWRSKVMRKGDSAVCLDLDISGMRTITLVTSDAEDGIGGDHADWGNACIIHSGEPPSIIPYRPVNDSFVLTPAPSPEPRINGPKVVGIRPNTPFHFKIPASGEKPMAYTADNLPAGLNLDQKTGIITGQLDSKGSHLVTVRAKNRRGENTRTLRIESGDKLALTPPMGWNSWYCYGPDINEQRIRATARAMVKHGLTDYGWNFVNMDDGWQGSRGGSFHALQPNNKFTDMRQLCTDLHAMGLKAGIFTTMSISSPSGHIGSSSIAANGSAGDMEVPISGRSTTSQVFGTNPSEGLTSQMGRHLFLSQDTRQWAEWGFDFVKINGGSQLPNCLQTVRDTLNSSGRSMLYHANNYLTKDTSSLLDGNAQIWPTQSDGNDNWAHVSYTIQNAHKWHSYTKPGSWPSQGFLQLGSTHTTDSERGSHARCRLTPAEQYSHFSSLCLMAAPLILSCDLENVDPFTLSLLKNAEVIEVNQDPLGKAAKQAPENPSVWIKPMEDGSHVIGLFNLGKKTQTVTADLKTLGLSDNYRVRDLWRQADQADSSGTVSAEVEPHGVKLYRLWSK